MLQPSYGPFLPPVLFICDYSSFPPPSEKRPICGVGKCLPPPPQWGKGGGINKGNSWSSSTVTQADTLKTRMSTHASAHTHSLTAHQESMESPSLVTYDDFLLPCECVCQTWTVSACSERECRGKASCSDKLLHWTAILLQEKKKVKKTCYYCHFHPVLHIILILERYRNTLPLKAILFPILFVKKRMKVI